MGTFLEPRELRMLSETAIPLSVENVGIAAVAHGYYLREILASEQLKKARAAAHATLTGSSDATTRRPTGSCLGRIGEPGEGSGELCPVQHHGLFKLVQQLANLGRPN